MRKTKRKCKNQPWSLEKTLKKCWERSWFFFSPWYKRYHWPWYSIDTGLLLRLKHLKHLKHLVAILSIWAYISKVFTLFYRASLIKVFLALISKIKWRFHRIIIRHRNSAFEFLYESIACTTICTLYVKINQLYLGLAHFPAAVT